MRVIITGAAGFVGQHLRRHLLAHTDWTLCHFSYPILLGNLLPDREEEHLVDLRDAQRVQDKLRAFAPDAIIHLAGQSHVPTSFADPWDTLETNIRGQLNLLEGCVRLNLRPRIVVVSSGEVYGRLQADQGPLDETLPLLPENPYSVSKAAQDLMGYQYFISHKLPVIRIRPFNHVGPGQSERFVLPAFAAQIARIEAGLQEPVLRVGNLDTARDFTDVRDVARAYELAVRYAHPGEAYNLASGVPRTIRSLLEALLALAAVPIRVEVDLERFRPSDTPVLYGNAMKFRGVTGWQPLIPFEQTVADVLAEWRRKIALQRKARGEA